MRRWYFSLILSVMLMGCISASQEATNAPPTDIATIEVTDAPTDEATLEATSTETATPTRHPTLTPTPAPEGFYDRVYVSDANLIIYRRNDAICAIQGGSVPSFLIDAEGVGDFQVSSDGTLIRFLAWHTTEENGFPVTWYELWVIKPDGTDRRRLVGLSDLMPVEALGDLDDSSYDVVFEDLVWIPGSHRLMFTTAISDRLQRAYDGISGRKYSNDLYTIDADTGTLQMMLASGSGGAYITLSPDGRIAILEKRHEFIYSSGDYPTTVRPDTISLIGVDGSNLQADMLTYEATIVPFSLGNTYYDPIITWLPDSSSVNVVLFPKNPRMTDAGGSIEGW